MGGTMFATSAAPVEIDANSAAPVASPMFGAWMG